MTDSRVRILALAAATATTMLLLVGGGSAYATTRVYRNAHLAGAICDSRAGIEKYAAANSFSPRYVAETCNLSSGKKWDVKTFSG